MAAWSLDLQPSNLSIQKLLFFAYADILVETGVSLFENRFEAWKFGPVDPLVYSAFKKYGETAISELATQFDPKTLRDIPIPRIQDSRLRNRIHAAYKTYSSFSPAALVSLSHAKASPWDVVWDSAAGRVVQDMRIPDELIFEYHRGRISGRDTFGSKPTSH